MAPSSSLLLDEYFAAGDERFLDEVLASTAGRKLKALADRWYGDARPFARRALLRYLDDGCDRPHHRPLVKGLFKLAEMAGDDEAMGHFMVAFDRLVRRRLALKNRWDPGAGRVFRHDPEVPLALGDHESRAPRFSRRTRLYLVRRAFRYFRALARRDPLRYGQAIRAALALYEDRHLETPAQLLDSWSLVHALYWASPVLVRDPRGVRVAEGRALADLAPAPFAPDAWQGALHGLLDLLAKAQSRPVRSFTIALLQRDYADALRGMPLGRVRALLRSPHDEVQAFAAQLLQSTRGASQLTVDEWLELLKLENPLALPLICDMVVRTVAPERLSLAQCVKLACSKAGPVAALGLRWACTKPVNDEAALVVALGLAGAAVPHVREEGAAWVSGILGAAAFGRPEHLRDLIDARFPEPRAAALALFEKDARFRDSTTIWAALAESPYDDVRAALVRHLGERERSFTPPARRASPGAASSPAPVTPEMLRHVWVTTLLAVHRGGRAKRGALDQVAGRIARCPAEAEALLPLLAIALRSVRAPEQRTALAAVARAAIREPALRVAVARALPELKLSGEVAA